MTNGPIEFMGEENRPRRPATEFGGEDGLIQPEKPEALKGDPAASGGHGPDSLTPSELNGMMARQAGVPLVGLEQTTGVSASGEVVIDPVTGREVPLDRIEDGLSAKLSDQLP